MNPSDTVQIAADLKVLENCLSCVHHQDGLFCRLPVEALQELNTIRQDLVYQRNGILFLEGELPRGLFILCSGRARLSITSREGKRLQIREAEPGEVLGLSSVVAGKLYPVTTEIIEPSCVSFIPRPKFLDFMERHAQVSARVAEHLSVELHKAWEQALLLGTAASTQAKLAHLLLSWAIERGKATPQGTRMTVTMTQQEIGEIIGANRETVSRMLNDFKRRGWIRVNGNSLTLLQTDELRALSNV